MSHTNIDWTHTSVIIADIRKLSKLYVISLKSGGLILNDKDTEKEPIMFPLFVKDSIFEERLKSYFLKDISNISRDEILSVKWNMHITKSYYIKINERGGVDKFPHDLGKWYISFLEIDGPLGTFSSVYRDKELNK